MRTTLALAILLCGCSAGPANDVPQFASQDFVPMRGATQQAMADCGGPYVAWSSVTSRSLFPYRVESTEWMRCLRDGRIVGPYTYRTDGL